MRGRPCAPLPATTLLPLYPKPKSWTWPARLLLCVGIVATALPGCSRVQPTAAEVRAQWREKTHQAIRDPVRARQVAERVGRLLDAQEAGNAALQAASEHFVALNADYHATSEQVTATYQEYEARQREALVKFRDELFALRREVSPAEWAILVD